MLTKKKKMKNLSLYLMLLPATIVLIIFAYVPLAGVIIAFQDFIPAKGFFGVQNWVGFDNFKYIFTMPDTIQVINNTVYIAFFKLSVGLIFAVVVAIMLNEVRSKTYKKAIQTIIYIPHFLSWVLLSGIFIELLSPSTGLVNKAIELLGFKPIFFLGDTFWFPITMIATDIWKELGFSTIIYLAAITSIDQQIYEAAIVDGAGKWRQVWHITLPGMRMIIVLMSLLSLGNVLNAGFDQIVNMYNAQVYQTGDILDTLVYRLGLLDGQFSVATAVGLFKSGVSAFLVSSLYFLAYKVADYRIF